MVGAPFGITMQSYDLSGAAMWHVVVLLWADLARGQMRHHAGGGSV